MKLLFICLYLYCISPCYGGIFEGIGKIFGISKDDNSEKLLNAIKETASNNKLLSDLTAEVSGIKSSVGDIKTNLSLNTNATAQLSNKITGYDKSVKKTITETVNAGRDNIKTTTNDSEIVKAYIAAGEKQATIYKVIIIALMSQMCGLIGQMIILLKWQGKIFKEMYEKIIAELNRQISLILTSKDKKEEKLDEWQGKLIEKVFDEKNKKL